MHNGLADASDSPVRGRTAAPGRNRRERTAVVVAIAVLLAFPAICPAATLSVVPNGPEGVAVTAEAAGVANPPCQALSIKTTACTYTLPHETMVTLKATGNQFVGWSDVRCPPTPTCIVSLDQASTTVTG